MPGPSSYHEVGYDDLGNWSPSHGYKVISEEVEEKWCTRFYFYEKICPELRRFDKVKLKSPDHQFRVKFNQVVHELNEGDIHLKRVRPLSWTRWMLSWYDPRRKWKAPDY
jgi:hypothetical protein